MPIVTASTYLFLVDVCPIETVGSYSYEVTEHSHPNTSSDEQEQKLLSQNSEI